MTGRLPEFDSSVENFRGYSRRLQQFFVGSDISDDVKESCLSVCYRREDIRPIGGSHSADFGRG